MEHGLLERGAVFHVEYERSASWNESFMTALNLSLSPQCPTTNFHLHSYLHQYRDQNVGYNKAITKVSI